MNQCQNQPAVPDAEVALKGMVGGSKKFNENEKVFFLCQNQVQSDEEILSIMCKSIHYCMYDLQGKKLWMGSDAGRYLI